MTKKNFESSVSTEAHLRRAKNSGFGVPTFLGYPKKWVPQISSEMPEKSSDIPENKFKYPKISSDIVGYALFLVFGYI